METKVNDRYPHTVQQMVHKINAIYNAGRVDDHTKLSGTRPLVSNTTNCISLANDYNHLSLFALIFSRYCAPFGKNIHGESPQRHGVGIPFAESFEYG